MKINRNILLVALLLSALSLSAQSNAKLLRRGNRQYRKGNYEKAEATYQRILAETPNQAKAQFNLGDAYYAQENYDGAFKAFQKVLDMTPDVKLKSNAVYNMGNCLLAQQKYYDAFNIYKVSLRLNPDNADALYNLEFCRAHLVKSRVIVQPAIAHGRVEASEKTAFNGQQVTLSAKADPDFALASYVVTKADNPEVNVEVKGNAFVMPKFDVLVSAQFNQAHRIDVEKNIPHGEVTADKAKAIEGQSVTLHSKPEKGYMVEHYKVYRTGKLTDTVPVTDTVFQMPDFDVTVTATFRTALHVNVQPAEFGKIQATDTLALPGQNIALIVKPEKG